jgi:hypothetical protein
LLQGTETLEDGSRRLENAHRIALETEDVGADILRNLRGQREQIEHTRDTVGSYTLLRNLPEADHRRIDSTDSYSWFTPTLRSSGQQEH